MNRKKKVELLAGYIALISAVVGLIPIFVAIMVESMQWVMCFGIPFIVIGFVALVTAIFIHKGERKKNEA